MRVSAGGPYRAGGHLPVLTGGGHPAAEMEDQVDAATADAGWSWWWSQSRVMDAFNEERLGECLRCCARALMPRWAAKGRTYADSPT